MTNFLWSKQKDAKFQWPWPARPLCLPSKMQENPPKHDQSWSKCAQLDVYRCCVVLSRALGLWCQRLNRRWHGCLQIIQMGTDTAYTCVGFGYRCLWFFHAFIQISQDLFTQALRAYSRKWTQLCFKQSCIMLHPPFYQLAKHIPPVTWVIRDDSLHL